MGDFFRGKFRVQNDDITTVPPTSGDHYAGEILRDSSGNLWLCEVSGNPGTWTRLGKIKNPYDWFKSENPNYLEMSPVPNMIVNYTYGSPSGQFTTLYFSFTYIDKNNNYIPALCCNVNSGSNASNPVGALTNAYSSNPGSFGYIGLQKCLLLVKFATPYFGNTRDNTICFSLCRYSAIDANNVIWNNATALNPNAGIYKDSSGFKLFWIDGESSQTIDVTRIIASQSETKEIWLYYDNKKLYYMIDLYDYTKFTLLHEFSSALDIKPQYLANAITNASTRIDFISTPFIFSRGNL